MSRQERRHPPTRTRKSHEWDVFAILVAGLAAYRARRPRVPAEMLATTSRAVRWRLEWGRSVAHAC